MFPKSRYFCSQTLTDNGKKQSENLRLSQNGACTPSCSGPSRPCMDHA